MNLPSYKSALKVVSQNSDEFAPFGKTSNYNKW